jgi:hypothetical protein
LIARRRIRALVAVSTATMLAIAAGTMAAPAFAAGTVKITAALPPGDVGTTGATSGLMALYVDSSGAAHVAWVAADGDGIDLCTIPARGSSCGTPSTINAIPAGESGEVESIKYLPNTSTGVPALLAVGIDFLQPAPPVDRFADDPGTAEELFALGGTAAALTGEVSVPTGGAGAGDVILEPDASGLDVVGVSESGPPDFQFQSLVAGGTSSGVTGLAGQSQRLIDVTKLPQGQTAVLADPTSTEPGKTAVGMFVQSAAGGVFSPLRPLGISGPSIATSSSGGSYVLNVETGSNAEVDCFAGAPMELYEFRGLSLKPIASIGSAMADINAVNWADLPPVFEDATGNYYAGWVTEPDFDGCNPGDKLDICVMYRRIATGGLLGPKIVMTTVNDQQEALGPIGANAKGVGWLLRVGQTFGNDTTAELDAMPLPSSAAAGTPAVGGSSVTVPVSCGGAPTATCLLSAVLTLGSGSATAASASKSKATVLARATKKLKGGSSTKLVIRLSKPGKKLLAKRHRLKAHLLVTEVVGAVKAPTAVLSKTITFKHR